MSEFKKNKIWGALTTAENIERYKNYPFFFANSNHCLIISDEQPKGTVEMTEEFIERFRQDDWAWLNSVIGKVQQAQLKQYPEEAKERADEIIKNTYRSLMTRGMKGCYVYCTDTEMADYMRRRLAAYAEGFSALNNSTET